MSKAILSASLLLTMLISTSLWAAPTNYPRGCNPKSVGFNSNEILLGVTPSERSYRVYVLYNKAGFPIRLNQPVTEHPIIKDLDTEIKPHSYSAILVPKENYKLLCEEQGASEIYPLRCQELVDACELAVSKVALSRWGNYWITQNQRSKGALFRSVRSRGIFP